MSDPEIRILKNGKSKKEMSLLNLEKVMLFKTGEVFQQ